MLIAPKVGGLKVKGGTLKADGQLAGSPSVLFDAVALVLAPEAAAKLCKEGAAVQFVMDAFGHVKTIGHDAGAKALLDKAGVEPDAGVVGLEQFCQGRAQAPLGPRAQGAHAGVGRRELRPCAGARLQLRERGLEVGDEVGLFPREEVALGLAPEVAVGRGLASRSAC